MKKIFFLFSLLFLFSKSVAQQFVPFYGTVVDQVSSSNILTNLTEFENLGVKRKGTTALQNTLDWLKTEYLSYGYTTAQMQEYSFTNGTATCKNLVVTKVGTLYPDTF
nr:leucyl aminopeptidase [Flavobacterium sp.]